MTRFILETNYRPIIRAVETEAKPRQYQDATGLSRIVEAIAVKVSDNGRVFRIESEEGVFMGVGVLGFGSEGVTVPYIRLRSQSVAQILETKNLLLQIADLYAPLYSTGLQAGN